MSDVAETLVQPRCWGRGVPEPQLEGVGSLAENSNERCDRRNGTRRRGVTRGGHGKRCPFPTRHRTEPRTSCHHWPRSSLGERSLRDQAQAGKSRGLPRWSEGSEWTPYLA